MRKLLVRTTTGLIENIVEMPEQNLVDAAKFALTVAEAAKAALAPDDSVGAQSVDAALQAAQKQLTTLSWVPSEGFGLVDDILSAGPGDSVINGILVKAPRLPPAPTPEQVAQAIKDAADLVTATIAAIIDTRLPAQSLTVTEKAALTEKQLNLINKAQGR